MEIPTSGVVNRYIAAQGPLPHTAVDFWQVVWEQLCPTVVMLTATVERGRVKCHQYWPRLYESQDYGRLQISCLREKETAVGWTREFSLVNQEVRFFSKFVCWSDFVGFKDRVYQGLQLVWVRRTAYFHNSQPTFWVLIFLPEFGKYNRFAFLDQRGTTRYANAIRGVARSRRTRRAETVHRFRFSSASIQIRNGGTDGGTLQVRKFLFCNWPRFEIFSISVLELVELASLFLWKRPCVWSKPTNLFIHWISYELCAIKEPC